MSVFRIGWVNPREDGDQVRMLQDNCTKLGLDHDRIVKTGKTFKGRCDDCAKEPSFTVLYNTVTGSIGWACKLHKDQYDYYHNAHKKKRVCYMCENRKAVRDADTCEECKPRIRTTFTGCASCDILFEGSFCLRHELEKGLMKQCGDCRIFYRDEHVCCRATHKSKT